MPGQIPGYPAPADTPILMTGATFNALVEFIVANGLAANPGAPFVRTRGGVVLKLPPAVTPTPDQGLRWATTPAPGIAAGSTGSITYVNGGGGTATAYNRWSADNAPGGKKCLVGNVDGELCILLWGCN